MSFMKKSKSKENTSKEEEKNLESLVKEGKKKGNAIFEGNGTIERIPGVRKWLSIAKSINKHQFLPIDVPFVADIEVNVTLRSVNDS